MGRTAVYIGVAVAGLVGFVGLGHSWLESVHISGERSARTVLLTYGSLASVVVAVAFGLAAATRLDRKRLLRTFEERQELSERQFLEEFYPDLYPWHKELIELWAEIGKEVHVPFRKLRPPDKLELFPSRVWGDELAVLTMRLITAQRHLGLGDKDLDVMFSGTLDDYVRIALADKMRDTVGAKDVILEPLLKRVRS